MVTEMGKGSAGPTPWPEQGVRVDLVTSTADLLDEELAEEFADTLGEGIPDPTAEDAVNLLLQGPAMLEGRGQPLDADAATALTGLVQLIVERAASRMGYALVPTEQANG